ncbi:MAG: diaminopimelate decarboxylase [Rhodospirillales bacterium]|nr:diaminopimelate decarboxylase [Rhodospirillales bacterium]
MNASRRPETKLRYPKFKKSFSEFIGIGSNGHLWVDGCDTVDLANQFGTPLYIWSEGQLRHNYRRFRDAWQRHYDDVHVLFANKSNNGLAIRHIMNQEGAGGDAFGYNELYFALLAGADPKKTVLNGSNKGEEELELAIANGVCINIDAMDEIDLIDKIAKRLRVEEVDLGIRVKLALDPLKKRFGVSMHGPGSLQEQAASHKWGMTLNETCELVKRIAKMKNMKLRELHYHLSRMDNKASDFAIMAREMVLWTAKVRDKTGFTPEAIDIGGGWSFGRKGGTGPAGVDDESAATYEDYAREVCKAVKDEARNQKLKLPTLKMEPGRSISGSIGVAVGRVGAIKRHPTKTWVNLDMSSNHLPWTAFASWYFPCVVAGNADGKGTDLVDVVGPLCNSDELGPHRKLPKVKRGDLIAFLDVGGYQESSASRYNAQCLPAAVLVSGDRADIVSERETTLDVMRRFRVPPRLLAESQDMRVKGYF